MSALTAAFDAGLREGNVVPMPQSNTKIWKGGALAIVLGTGNVLALDPANLAHQFVGIATESFDNTAGSAGGRTTWVRRRGAFNFNQSGITQASLFEPAYFSDDNTVTTTPGTQYAGQIVGFDTNSKVWVDIAPALGSPSLGGSSQRAYSKLSGATDAINPKVGATYIITKAGVDAMTLAAPTDVVDDGTVIEITSSTANAHTLTATGLLRTGSASVNLATFAAQAGAGLTLMAFNAKWHVLYAIGITFS